MSDHKIYSQQECVEVDQNIRKHSKYDSAVSLLSERFADCFTENVRPHFNSLKQYL